MEYSVDLGPRAQNDPLAREIRRRILRNIQLGRAERSFARMWGTVVIVRRATHTAKAGSGRPAELTLRFDYGHLLVHGGRVGRPDVTLWGTDEEVLGLGDEVRSFDDKVGVSALGGLFRRVSALKIAVFGPKSAENLGSSLNIFGRRSHLRFVYRLAQLLDTSA